MRPDSDDTRRAYDELSYAAANSGINFAGHYTLAEVGCGAGCLRVAAIDARTGSVRWLPQTVSGWPPGIREPTSLRPDSRLVVVLGRLDERGPVGAHRFVFDGKRFVALPRAWRGCRAR